MSGAKSTVAKYCAELKTADAVPRSLAGNQAATMRPFRGRKELHLSPPAGARQTAR
jgi:hypothetical protein